jgi:hypothetical protein
MQQVTVAQKSFVSVYRAYYVSTKNIFMWIWKCNKLHKRHTADYLCVLFVGEGVKRWHCPITRRSVMEYGREEGKSTAAHGTSR